MSVISEFKFDFGNIFQFDFATPTIKFQPGNIFQFGFPTPTIKFQSGNNGQFQWSDNCDYYGGDIELVAVPREECDALCTKKKECTHFTWNGQLCILKNFGTGYVAPTLWAGAVCGYVIRPLSISWKIGANKRIIWSSDCNFVDFDIQDIASSKDDCINHCANNRKCTHFSYQNKTGVCSLKQIDSSSITPILTENVFCGYVSKLFKQYDGNKTNLDWYSGKDYFKARMSNKTLE